MKLEVRNVARIKSASMSLDGITVLAGKNGEGKSTIAKALSALISSNNRMDEDIRYQREQSVSRWLEDFNFSLKVGKNEIKGAQGEDSGANRRGSREFADRLLELHEDGKLTSASLIILVDEFFSIDEKNYVISEEKFASLKSILETPRTELERYTVYRAFREKFNNQVNSLVGSGTAKVALTLNGNECSEVEFNDNKVTSFLPFETKSAKRISAVFLESPSRFDSSYDGVGRSINTSLRSLLEKGIPRDELYEDFKKRESSLANVDNYIQQIIHGKFLKDTESRELTFKDDCVGNCTINLSNVSSGVKVFAVIRRLVENRSLRENTVLIIDEPETGLHPEWQVKFAYLLGLISKEIGVRMLLATHSPYFLRAVEVMAENISYADNVKYYIMDNFSSYDVTDKTEVIYKELYKPLEEL